MVRYATHLKVHMYIIDERVKRLKFNKRRKQDKYSGPVSGFFFLGSDKVFLTLSLFNMRDLLSAMTSRVIIMLGNKLGY